MPHWDCTATHEQSGAVSWDQMTFSPTILVSEDHISSFLCTDLTPDWKSALAYLKPCLIS